MVHAVLHPAGIAPTLFKVYFWSPGAGFDYYYIQPPKNKSIMEGKL